MIGASIMKELVSKSLNAMEINNNYLALLFLPIQENISVFKKLQFVIQLRTFAATKTVWFSENGSQLA